MNASEFQNLVQFFGSYFHQDWRLDDPDPHAVIERFLQMNPVEDVVKVVSELDVLLERRPSEDDLRKMLVSEFLCYYLPDGNGSIQLWLRQVRDQLVSSIVTS